MGRILTNSLLVSSKLFHGFFATILATFSWMLGLMAKAILNTESDAYGVVLCGDGGR